ncbi:MAG: hypothetical protein ACRDFB_02090 [Rhabdochlamydiaceae bacterium]
MQHTPFIAIGLFVMYLLRKAYTFKASSGLLPKDVDNSTVKKESVVKPKLNPVTEQEIQKRKQQIDEFKNKALATFQQPKLEMTQLDFSLTEEQKNCLEKAMEKKYSCNPNPIPGVKKLRGGYNFVFFLDSASGFVFKPMNNQSEAEEYVKVANDARQVVVSDNLYLFHVPESRVIKINDQYFVMQEKAHLLFSDYKGQKGIYLTCWNDKRMKDYMITLFSQLIRLIKKTNFSDIKYDNIPISIEGKVELIDLDQSSLISGLTTGGAGKKDGLFNYIPSEYLEEVLEIVKGEVEEPIYKQLVEKMGEFKKSATKKENKNNHHLQFLQKNSALIVPQTINQEIPKIFEDKKEQNFAQSIITTINQKLLNSENFSIQIGRLIDFGINNQDSLITDHARNIWGKNLFYHQLVKIVNPALENVLEGLKNAEYIHRYKIVHSGHYVKIAC